MNDGREIRYFTDRAVRYASAVLAGEILTNLWVRKACQRFFDDLERAGQTPEEFVIHPGKRKKKLPKHSKKARDKEFPFKFDIGAAEHACQFVEFMPHVKGEKAGRRELLMLEPWQCFIFCSIFGWIHETTRKRRFRKVYIEIPKKNGKSPMGSAIANYCLLADREEGAEVYTVAAQREQAGICFNDARAMLSKASEVAEVFGAEVHKYSISVPSTNSSMKALAKDHKGTQDGLNIHCAIVDELHAHPKRDTWDIIAGGIAARSQPLIVAITTAGFNRASVCYEQHLYIRKLLDGIATDERYFGIIYSADEGDDWREESTWRKANPNLGVSVDLDYIRQAVEEAKVTPAKVATFQTKHLNIWVGSAAAWLDMDRWNSLACDFDEDDLAKDGWKLAIGVDLAMTTDISSVARVWHRISKEFPGEFEYRIACRHFVSEKHLQVSSVSDLTAWVMGGHFDVTPGDAISFMRIQDDVHDNAKRWKAKAVAFDPRDASQMMIQLEERRVRNLEKVAPTSNNMTPAMREVEKALAEGRLRHNGDPVMAWMVSNVLRLEFANGTLRPGKDMHDKNAKIDGVAAMLTALSTVISKPATTESPKVFSFNF